jgi:hypothetical protein
MHILVSTFWNLTICVCVFTHIYTYNSSFNVSVAKLQYQEICFSIHPFCFWNKSCCEESLKWFCCLEKNDIHWGCTGVRDGICAYSIKKGCYGASYFLTIWKCLAMILFSFLLRFVSCFRIVCNHTIPNNFFSLKKSYYSLHYLVQRW